ncbi:hypothetical protein PIIN_08908 [Serendipita indica DSM 11827]|uniref:Transmembrane protein n=1 Tax=Serendipita indica (strain DSM 11827) TaxID=1109443 RepID=G4U356_SERID|nr:hypothetical protein PIIN_08908 [Serendipita indica DSM 11827]
MIDTNGRRVIWKRRPPQTRRLLLLWFLVAAHTAFATSLASALDIGSTLDGDQVYSSHTSSKALDKASTAPNNLGSSSEPTYFPRPAVLFDPTASNVNMEARKRLILVSIIVAFLILIVVGSLACWVIILRNKLRIERMRARRGYDSYSSELDTESTPLPERPPNIPRLYVHDETGSRLITTFSSSAPKSEVSHDLHPPEPTYQPLHRETVTNSDSFGEQSRSMSSAGSSRWEPSYAPYPEFKHPYQMYPGPRY